MYSQTYIGWVFFVDQDGVLSDFIHGVCRNHGVPWEEVKKRYTDHDRLIQAVNPDFKESDMWRMINGNVSFWENLPVYPWANELIDTVKKSGADWYVLTSPGTCETSYVGKLRWLRNHFGKSFNRFIPVPATIDGVNGKSLLARNKTLLIDDREKNIRAFRAAGGEAILFPSLGCSDAEARSYHDRPLDYVRKQLIELMVKLRFVGLGQTDSCH